MFCLDLDEIDSITDEIPFISRNRFNFFSFRDQDHLVMNDQANNIKDQLLLFLKENGIENHQVGQVKLITNLSTFGYQFNPVSFYYCYNPSGTPLCAVAEVSNTYREMKLYFLPATTFKAWEFTSLQTKHFYVSPFIDLDTSFDFHLGIPTDTVHIRIDDFKEDKRFFLSTLTGQQRTLTSWNVLKFAFRFPLITLQVMGLIHWQAFKLWLKKIGYHKKAANKHLELGLIKHQT